MGVLLKTKCAISSIQCFPYASGGVAAKIINFEDAVSILRSLSNIVEKNAETDTNYDIIAILGDYDILKK